MELAACSAPPQPVVTPVLPTVLPAKQSASPSAPQANMISPLQTATPLVQPTATNTPSPCPPFSFDTALPNPDVPDNYIGRHYDWRALPTGLRRAFGVFIEGPPDYAWSGMLKNNEEMYWLQRLICRDAKGAAYYEIRDALVLPRIGKDQTRADACKAGGNDIRWIIAFGKYDEKKPPIPIGESRGWKFYEVDFAWRIDTQAEKFIQLFTEDLECIKYVGPAQ